MPWDSNFTGCQVNKLIYLQPVGEILGTQRAADTVASEPLPYPQHLSSSRPTYSRVTKRFGPLHTLLSTYPLYKDTNHTGWQVNKLILPDL